MVLYERNFYPQRRGIELYYREEPPLSSRVCGLIAFLD